MPSLAPPLRLSILLLALAPATPSLAQDSPVDLAATLRGEGEPLTADAAAGRAIDTSPELAQAEATLSRSGAGADRARNGLLPQVEASFRYTRLSPVTNPDFGGLVFPIVLDQYVLRGTVSYPVSDAFVSALPAWEAAETAVDARRLQVEDARQRIALQAREAYYDLARARGGLAIAELSLRNAEAQLGQVEAFVEAGTAAPVDELRIRAQVATARVSVAQSRAAVGLAEEALRTLMHVDADVPIAVAEPILTPLEPLDGQLETLLQEALDHRPDLRALTVLIRAAGQQASSAEGTRYPSVAVNMNVDFANPNQRIFPLTQTFQTTWDISAIVSWSLQEVLDGDRQAAEAYATQDERAEQLRAAEDAVRVEIAQAVTSYAAAIEAYAAAELGVEAADESYRVQEVRYGEGVVTATDVIQSSLEQVQAQADRLNAAVDGRVAEARLRRALGREAL